MRTVPSIRPNSTVRFKDTSGTLLYQTGADVFLSALDEKTPAVKTITVNVPARDGVLDLTESVAGRPLYGNRSIVITLSVLKADHPSAVAEVRAMRRAIHGQMCRVETPDNIIPDSSTTIPGATIQGWYVGRVSIGEVKYPGEAAVVKITVDAQPWIYYGTGTVTLAHSAPTTYTYGAIASADRTRMADAVLAVSPQYKAYLDTTANYTWCGYVPTSVALVLSRTANLLEYGTMAQWCGWQLPNANPSWSDDWSRADWWSTDDAGGTITGETRSDTAHRAVLYSTAGSDGVLRGILGPVATNDCMRVTVTVNVASVGTTYHGNAPGVYAFYQDNVGNPNAPASGSGLLDGNAPTYTSLWTTSDQTGTDLTYTYQHVFGNLGFYNIGIETRWVEATISIRVELMDYAATVGYTGMTNADNSIVTFTAPEPLYSRNQSPYERNVVNVTPYGASEDVALRIPSGSNTAAVVSPTDNVPMQSVNLDGSAMYVRAYGMNNYGWLPLETSMNLYPWSTESVDFGDMPSGIAATIGSPTMFEVGGARAVMTDSGTLPLTLHGATTLDYMVMGSNDGTLTYEQGTV